MTNQVQHELSITDNLQKVFEYAFIEPTSYHFVFPKADKFVPIKITKKEYRCLHCGEMMEVFFKERDFVYIEKVRLDRQQWLYDKLELQFPNVELGEPLVYLQEGYCKKCFSAHLQNTENVSQFISNICSDLNKADVQVVDRSKGLMDATVRQWLAGIASIDQLSGYDLSNYISIRSVISQVIGSTEALTKCVNDYRQETDKLIKTAVLHLAKITEEKFEAYVGYPINAFDSMSDTLYNEYTVLFPEDDTLSEKFYVKLPVRKERVLAFLEQKRIDDVSVLMNETGFSDEWIEWLVEHVEKISSIDK